MILLNEFGLSGVDRVEESQIFHEGEHIGFHFSILREDKKKIGSGFHAEKNIARQIALAEYFERDFVEKMSKSNSSTDWGLDTNPTACGFAVGFNNRNTQIRSIFEATERWALSQWFDQKKQLDSILINPATTTQKYWSSHFEKIKTFKRDFIYTNNTLSFPMSLCLFLGWSGQGVYMGSAVRASLGDAFEHASLEAVRHKIIFEQNRTVSHFPYNRINHFGRNGSLAEDLICEARDNDWPSPSLMLSKNERIGNIFIHRTIFKDWTPWESGPLSRMLY